MAYDFLSNFKTSYNYYLLFHMHTIFPVSKAFEIFSTIVKIAWFVEWYFLNPNWKLYSILLCSRKSITWLYILYKNRRSPKLVCSLNQLLIISFINRNHPGQLKLFRKIPGLIEILIKYVKGFMYTMVNIFTMDSWRSSYHAVYWFNNDILLSNFYKIFNKCMLYI